MAAQGGVRRGCRSSTVSEGVNSCDFGAFRVRFNLVGDEAVVRDPAAGAELLVDTNRVFVVVKEVSDAEGEQSFPFTSSSAYQ